MKLRRATKSVARLFNYFNARLHAIKTKLTETKANPLLICFHGRLHPRVKNSDTNPNPIPNFQIQIPVLQREKEIEWWKTQFREAAVEKAKKGKIKAISLSLSLSLVYLSVKKFSHLSPTAWSCSFCNPFESGWCPG